jgi:hypothetical protein
VTDFTVGWSSLPCPGAFKLKFFRPDINAPSPTGPVMRFLAERGPIHALLVPPPIPLPGPILFTTRLDSPVPLEPGDLIGITPLAPCGTPYLVPAPSGSGALSLAGDVRSDFSPVVQAQRLPVSVLVAAFGRTDALLLFDRFEVRLTATDPRTHATAAGFAVAQSDLAGYFSLPDFTGDSYLPEVGVKMLDATDSPELGGTYWFFFASLTDVDFELTVLNLGTGEERRYRSRDSGSAQLCGGVDTSAFRR